LQSKENLPPLDRPPRVWILASRHSGDNTQLLALAGALGWPCDVKRLSYRKYEEVLRLTGLPTLAGVDLAKSSAIEAPWPDLVISAGRSTEAVGFWIRRHGNPNVRLVFVGTPWADPASFDLVITTPQYGLPKAPNILHNALPLHGVTPEKLASEAARWEDRLSHLPKARIALLVGGSSGPYLFGPESAQRLGREASRIAAEKGGALLVTTSARTPVRAADALQESITVPSFFYRWEKGAADNPFHAFLGMAESNIVTGDSISMLSEASATGKPVFLFDIEEGAQAMRAEEGRGPTAMIHWRGRSLDTTAFRLLMRHAPTRWSRDLRIVHRHLVEHGLASWLGEEPGMSSSRPGSELASTAARVRQLFGL
jgi:mitochondrial fission protein ELM1